MMVIGSIVALLVSNLFIFRKWQRAEAALNEWHDDFQARKLSR